MTNWLPDSGYELREGPEIEVAHWYDDDRYLRRYIEIWLPIRKKEQPAAQGGMGGGMGGMY